MGRGEFRAAAVVAAAMAPRPRWSRGPTTSRCATPTARPAHVVPAAADRRVRGRARHAARWVCCCAAAARRPGRPARGAARALEPRPDPVHRQRAGHLVRRLRRVPQPQELRPLRHRPPPRRRSWPDSTAAVARPRPGGRSCTTARHRVGQLGDGCGLPRLDRARAGHAGRRAGLDAPLDRRRVVRHGHLAQLVLGALLYYAVPSLGPVYSSPEWFADLPPTPNTSVRARCCSDRVEVLAGPWDTRPCRPSQPSPPCTWR